MTTTATSRQESSSAVVSEASLASPPASSMVTGGSSRRTAFNLHVLVHGCSNIPHQTNARVYCKWKLPGSLNASREQVGVLPPTETTSTNLVVWDASIELLGCVFKVDTTTKLLKSEILRLSIRQESRSALKGFVRLGIVQIDLAEFAGQTTMDRTYLLENSRLNSTLSVTVSAEQVGGDVMFRRRSSSSSVDEESTGGTRLLRRMKLPSGASIPSLASATQSTPPHSPLSTSSIAAAATSPHTIYQVVGVILRISEETRLSRQSSRLDTMQQ